MCLFAICNTFFCSEKIVFSTNGTETFGYPLGKKQSKKYVQVFCSSFIGLVDFFKLHSKCSVHILAISNLSGKCLVKWPVLSSDFAFHFLNMPFKRQKFCFLIMVVYFVKFFIKWFIFCVCPKNLCQTHSHRIPFGFPSRCCVDSAHTVRSVICAEFSSVHIKLRFRFCLLLLLGFVFLMDIQMFLYHLLRRYPFTKKLLILWHLC